MANDQRTTLVAAFQDRFEAEKAVDELEQAGFGSDEVRSHLSATERGSHVCWKASSEPRKIP